MKTTTDWLYLVSDGVAIASFVVISFIAPIPL